MACGESHKYTKSMTTVYFSLWKYVQCYSTSDRQFYFAYYTHTALNEYNYIGVYLRAHRLNRAGVTKEIGDKTHPISRLDDVTYRVSITHTTTVLSDSSSKIQTRILPKSPTNPPLELWWAVKARHVAPLLPGDCALTPWTFNCCAPESWGQHVHKTSIKVMRFCATG